MLPALRIWVVLQPGAAEREVVTYCYNEVGDDCKHSFERGTVIYKSVTIRPEDFECPIQRALFRAFVVQAIELDGYMDTNALLLAVVLDMFIRKKDHDEPVIIP